MISVFDFIKVVGGQKDPYSTWNRIINEQVQAFCTNLKFPGSGQKLTPVINVQGMVKLLFWLPGESAKQFRSKSAETMIRYLGGDLTLIDEIKAIDQEHIINPNNIAKVFREEIENSQIQNQHEPIHNHDLINISNQLINHFGNKMNLFYAFMFIYNNEWYSKFGIVGEVREFQGRLQEHLLEFERIYFYNILQCSNINKVESEFKDTALFNINKIKIPKKYGGNHTEIIKMSEIVTTNTIKEEMIKVAGERIVDPPPRYENVINYENIEIEKERTKQKEI